MVENTQKKPLHKFLSKIPPNSVFFFCPIWPSILKHKVFTKQVQCAMHHFLFPWMLERPQVSNLCLISVALLFLWHSALRWRWKPRWRNSFAGSVFRSLETSVQKKIRKPVVKSKEDFCFAKSAIPFVTSLIKEGINGSTPISEVEQTLLLEKIHKTF